MTVVPRGQRRYVFRSAFRRGLTGMLDGIGAGLVWLATFGQGLQIDPERWQTPRRILVVRLDHLGDTLFMRPALQALRQAYPQAKIIALVSPGGAQLLEQDPFIDQLMVWNAPWFDRQQRRWPWEGCWDILHRLRAEDFDLSLDLRGDLRHHILLFLSQVRIRIGYGITGGGFLLHHSMPLRPGVHEVERDLDLVRCLGVGITPHRYPPLALTPAEMAWGQAAWTGQEPRVVVHPSAGDPQKCWPAEGFAQVCQQLAAHGCRVLLVGDAADKAAAEKVQALAPESVQSWVGQTTLRQLAGILQAANLFIGHDSGPAHLAVTQGVATIFIWNKTSAPEEWGPWGDGVASAVIQPASQEETVARIVAQARACLGPWRAFPGRAASRPSKEMS